MDLWTTQRVAHRVHSRNNNSRPEHRENCVTHVVGQKCHPCPRLHTDFADGRNRLNREGGASRSGVRPNGSSGLRAVALVAAPGVTCFSCGRRGPAGRSAPRCGRRSRRRRPGRGAAGRRRRRAALGDPDGQRADRQAVLDAGHGLAPDLGGQAAAGGAGERRVVVVAHPDAGDVVGGEADEPGVARGLGGAGLAGGRPAVGQLRAGAGAALDHLGHHPDQLARRALVDHPRTRAPGPPCISDGAVGLAAQRRSGRRAWRGRRRSGCRRRRRSSRRSVASETPSASAGPSAIGAVEAEVGGDGAHPLAARRLGHRAPRRC